MTFDGRRGLKPDGESNLRCNLFGVFGHDMKQADAPRSGASAGGYSRRGTPGGTWTEASMPSHPAVTNEACSSLTAEDIPLDVDVQPLIPSKRCQIDINILTVARSAYACQTFRCALYGSAHVKSSQGCEVVRKKI